MLQYKVNGIAFAEEKTLSELREIFGDNFTVTIEEVPDLTINNFIKLAQGKLCDKEEVLNELRHWQQRDIIHAVKYVRSISGWSLSNSKKFVKMVFAFRGFIK